jgi:hypothetical protein
MEKKLSGEAEACRSLSTLGDEQLPPSVTSPILVTIFKYRWLAMQILRTSYPRNLFKAP